LPIGLQRPDTVIEGAPIKDFKTLQAKSRQGIVGNEIQAKCLGVTH
jgi:hypothetical protein